MADQLEHAEREKYRTMWAFDSYRERSPGLRFLADALKKLSPMPASSIVDLGCGTGRVSAELQRLGFDVTGVDIADNACTEFTGPFVTASLWSLPEDLGRFQYGFCADVLEHIPTERVAQTLASIAGHASTVYFQIANFVCHEGDKIGEHLHLTVKPLAWWRTMLDEDWIIEHAEAAPKHHVFVCRSRVF
jgi:2-polyprenyl-3-methyl-5-hydroxy-6-metoxy-1,4-benzoquinol methylase